LAQWKSLRCTNLTLRSITHETLQTTKRVRDVLSPGAGEVYGRAVMVSMVIIVKTPEWLRLFGIF
jgi:hypothetical protein